MCNCGKKRNALNTQSTTANKVYVKAQPSYEQYQQLQPLNNKQTVMFQYTGKTALTLMGGTTGRSYRFNFPGDIQHIAVADATALLNISILKKLD